MAQEWAGRIDGVKKIGYTHWVTKQDGSGYRETCA